MTDLRRFGRDGYANFAQALIAEAEAFAGDASRALRIAREELESADRYRPLLQRAAGIALARLGQDDAAADELMHALASARERAFEYDIAATIDALDALGSDDSALMGERNEILGRLKIEQLPTPVLS